MRRLTKEQEREIRAIAAMRDEDIDFSDIPEVVDWTGAEMEEYNRRHDVPVHPLYAAGYASIGCAPCSRAVQPGEDPRAGRWWWESDGQKECGIHFLPDGSVRRLNSGH